MAAEAGDRNRDGSIPDPEPAAMSVYLPDAEDCTRDRAGTFADAAAIVPGFYDPLPIGGPSGDHADVMTPDDNSTNLRRSCTAPTAPIPSEVEMRATALLRAHPPTAPAARPAAGTAA